MKGQVPTIYTLLEGYQCQTSQQNIQQYNRRCKIGNILTQRKQPFKSQIQQRFALYKLFMAIAILSLCLIINGNVLKLPILPGSPLAHAATTHKSDASTYVDAVIVLDNVSQIAIHDPKSDRYSAAQLFVDLAPAGDQIGTVKISGSRNPSQLSGYHALTGMDSKGKDDLKHTLSPQVFGPVEGLGNPNYPAYITPALQAAGNMLMKAPVGNRRYIIVVTDAVALSGDQDNCLNAPQYHKWFCEVADLESQNISVVLLGFTKPGSEDALKPTKSYIEAHGGTVIPVADGAGLARRLALAYTDLLTRIHSTMFYADLRGVPGSLDIDKRVPLTNATFVALGDSGVSLASLKTPSGEAVAGKYASDGSYYASSPPGSGYWLETVSTGTLEGTWHLTPGSTAPIDILVIAVLEAHFELINPAPADPASDVSVRYVPQQGPVVLRASITDAGGGPLIGIPFTANPLSNSVPFSNDALPGHDASNVDAILQQSDISSGTVQVGLGSPLVSGVYLTKSFRIAPQAGLGLTQLNVPVPTLLEPGSSIHLSAQGALGATTSIYALDPEGAFSPPIASGNASVSGDFTLQRGCGLVYTFFAISEVTGQLANGEYDYITYAKELYQPQLRQVIIGQANSPSDDYLEWWGSQAHWTVTFTSSTCTDQNAALGVRLRGIDFNAPPVAIGNESQYSLTNGSAAFIVAENKQTKVQITANLGGCGPSLLDDRTASIQLLPTSQPAQGGPIVQKGTWQTTVRCPSVMTNARRYWPVTGFSLFLLSVLASNLLQRIRSLFRKPYLEGKIEYVLGSPDLVDTDEESDSDSAMRVPVSIPRWKHLPVWYLDRRIEGEQATYLFEPQESTHSLLKFSAKDGYGGRSVKVEATKYAHGDKTPMFQIMQTPIAQEEYQCDGEPITIGQDIIYPDIKVLPKHT